MTNPGTSLSPEELTSYRDAFSTFDINGDGRISTSELGTILRSLGRTPSDAEVQQIVAKIDQDRSGFIEFDEFIRLMASDGLNVTGYPATGKSPDEPQDELYQAFKSFDQDGSGKISKSELGALLSTLGERLSPDELQEMIKAADLNGDDEIDFPEFKKMVTGSTN